jgi:hypothetical protein
MRLSMATASHEMHLFIFPCSSVDSVAILIVQDNGHGIHGMHLFIPCAAVTISSFRAQPGANGARCRA